MGLGQVWMGRALIHGLENPSLVICQLSPKAPGESLVLPLPFEIQDWGL